MASSRPFSNSRRPFKPGLAPRNETFYQQYNHYQYQPMTVNPNKTVRNNQSRASRAQHRRNHSQKIMKQRQKEDTGTNQVSHLSPRNRAGKDVHARNYVKNRPGGSIGPYYARFYP